MTTLQTYLKNTLGFRVSTPKKPSENLIHAQNSTFAKTYNFYEIIISKVAVIVALRQSSEGMNGSNIGKEYQAMKEYFDFPLLLELQSIDATMRKLLIGKKVNFAVLGHQLHFPELCISLSEQNIRSAKSSKSLSIAAQVLLLYHLQKRSLAGIPFKDIAVGIGYSAKTVSLIAQELCNFGIARIETIGRNNILRFYKHGIDLYNQIDKWIQSPVLAQGYTDRDINTSGSIHTNRRIIISSKQAKEMKLKLYTSPKKHYVEVWKYNPAILAVDNNADALSILLSLTFTYYGTQNRSDYYSAKPKILAQIKWTDE